MKATSLVVMSVLLLGLTGTAVPAEPVSSVSRAADQAARQVAEAFKPLWGTILSSLPNDRYLVDVTAERGAYVGMELEIFREGEPFKHPVTGQVLGRMDRPVGVLRLVEVQDQFSVAEIVQLEDGEQFRQGDGVRVSKARILAGLANITSSVIDERQARTLTREIEAALLKTGRFEVMDERMMRSALVKEQVTDTTALTDPRVLGILRATLRLHAVIFPVIRSAQGGLNVELKVVSTFSGRPLYLASAEVRMAAAAPPIITPAAPQEPQAKPRAAALPPTSASNASPQGAPLPAWLGPPTGNGAVPNRNLVENPEFRKRFMGGAGQTYNIQTLPVGVLAIDFGDVTGDGEDELVALTRNEVMIFRRKGLFFVLEDRIPGTDVFEYVTLGVADINGNGVAEIFVTNAETRSTNVHFFTRLRSFVLEQRQDKYVPIWEEVPTYLRILKTPEYPEGLLLVQRLGNTEPYAGPVMRYRWDGNGYVQDPGFRLPKQQKGIFGFTLVDLNGNGLAELVTIGADGMVRAFNQEGREIAETKDSFGIFSHVSFRLPMDKNEVMDHPRGRKLRPAEAYKLFPIERPLVVTSLGPGGTPGILIARNVAAGGAASLFPSLELTEGGHVVHLAWDGGALKKQWETDYNKDMYVAGYGLFRAGGDRVLAVLTLDRGLFRTTEATLEVYRLAGTPERSPEASVSKERLVGGGR